MGWQPPRRQTAVSLPDRCRGYGSTRTFWQPAPIRPVGAIVWLAQCAPQEVKHARLDDAARVRIEGVRKQIEVTVVVEPMGGIRELEHLHFAAARAHGGGAAAAGRRIDVVIAPGEHEQRGWSDAALRCPGMGAEPAVRVHRDHCANMRRVRAGPCAESGRRPVAQCEVHQRPNRPSAVRPAGQRDALGIDAGREWMAVQRQRDVAGALEAEHALALAGDCFDLARPTQPARGEAVDMQHREVRREQHRAPVLLHRPPAQAPGREHHQRCYRSGRQVGGNLKLDVWRKALPRFLRVALARHDLAHQRGQPVGRCQRHAARDAGEHRQDDPARRRWTAAHGRSLAASQAAATGISAARSCGQWSPAPLNAISPCVEERVTSAMSRSVAT